MIRRICALGLATVSALTVASTGMTQNAPPTPQEQAERAVKVRQGLFEVQGFAFAPVAAMLKGAPVDAAVAQKEAARIQVTASMIPEVFAFDTRKFHVTTKAREAAWSKKADFEKKANDLRTAAANLEAAAKKGDRGGIVEATGNVGNACKSCHDDYRDK